MNANDHFAKRTRPLFFQPQFGNIDINGKIHHDEGLLDSPCKKKGGK